MIFNQPTSGFPSVRLVAFGKTAIAYAARIIDQADGPLREMLKEDTDWADARDAQAAVHQLDLQHTAILLIVVAEDASDDEVGDAVMLTWHAWMQQVSTIAVPLSLFTKRAWTSVQQPRAGEKATLFSFWRNLADAQLALPGWESEAGLRSLRWMYGILRSLATAGVLLLEPAWDLQDVQEVLDLPEARLVLRSHEVGRGATASQAMCEALTSLREDGYPLEMLSGMLVLLWQEEERKISIADVARVSRSARMALDSDALHMVLVARAQGRLPGIGACATLVLSRKQHTYAPGEQA